MTLKLFVEPYGDNTWTQEIINNIAHLPTSKDDCDFIVSSQIPWGTTDSTLIQRVLNSYSSESKHALVFLVSDYNEPFNIPENVLLFRTGMYKSKKKENEYLLPYIATKSDLNNHIQFETIPKRGIYPTIGFCGSVISHPSRLQYINKLKITPKIKKNFILKNAYWGGNPHNPNVIAEFIKNVRDNYFTLTTRGTGNWSARFYQVLYLGRIPVFINTDCVLPFEDKINWRDIIVYCDSADELNDKIMQFWNTKDIQHAQNVCKEIFNTYLSIESWCRTITNDILIPLKQK